MSNTDSKIGPSGVSRAGTKSAVPTVEVRARTEGKGELRASRDILDACTKLRTLLLRDDFNFGNSMLLGAVSEGLDRITAELNELAGLQKLFELWIDTDENTNECMLTFER